MLKRRLLGGWLGALLVIAACGEDRAGDPLPVDAGGDDAGRDDASAAGDADAAGAGAGADAAGERDADAAPDAQPPCLNLPPRDCAGAACADLVPFQPVTGPGYDNYAVNGETDANQYRSFARVDAVMLIKWSTAFTACNSLAWTEGNGGRLGLGDMSEANGAIPGTAEGSPGHPAGSHVDGYDIDTAYYQTGTADNRLRPVCPHEVDGADQHRCVGAPTTLDVKRTALFLGALLTSSRVRVIGVDGKIGPLVKPEIQNLCDGGVVPAESCTRLSRIAYEETDTGLGWYRFQHHHMHVSLSRP
jgi:hypothetical protein